MRAGKSSILYKVTQRSYARNARILYSYLRCRLRALRSHLPTPAPAPPGAADRTRMIAQTLRERGLIEDVPSSKVVCCICGSHGRSELPPPPLPSYSLQNTASPLVSVLSPTSTDRHWTHPNLYRCFAHQSWPNKELLILDTGEKPSSFFSALDDPRVRYTHVAMPENACELVSVLRRFVDGAARHPRRGGPPGSAGTSPHQEEDSAWREAWQPAVRALDEATSSMDWFELEDEGCGSPIYLDTLRRVLSLGSKRNWLSSQARGSILANFDDDDIYLPTYLERMVAAMQVHGASLVKLSSFMYLDLQNRSLAFCDPDQPVALPGWGGGDEEVIGSTHGLRWGFGFSVVHTTELAAACPYDHSANFGEDYAMVVRAAETSSPHFKCICFGTPVGDAVALHVGHLRNSSCVSFGRRVGRMGTPHSASTSRRRTSKGLMTSGLVNEPLGSEEETEASRAAAQQRSLEEDVAFDEYFASPCLPLVRAASNDLQAALVSEALARRHEALSLQRDIHNGTFDGEDGEERLLFAMRHDEAAGGMMGMGRGRLEASVARAAARRRM